MALQFNVSQLLKSGIGEIREYDFQAEEPIDLEDGVASNVRGHVKFTLTNFGIIANAHAAAQLHLTCARCLEPFGSPNEVDFEEEYQPLIDIAVPDDVVQRNLGELLPDLFDQLDQLDDLRFFERLHSVAAVNELNPD